MCEYCENKKAARSVTFNGDTSFSIFKNQLYVDGDIVFQISYCPICRKEAGRVKHITLKEMLEEIKDYYYKNNAGDYKKITSVDLMYRIKFGYDDFTEYEWELEESRLYKEESYDI